MLWCGLYLAVAALFGSALFLAANWFRPEHIAAPDFPGVVSALAGMLWPVLLVGASELALVWWAFRTARYAPLELVSLT